VGGAGTSIPAPADLRWPRDLVPAQSVWPAEVTPRHDSSTADKPRWLLMIVASTTP
jgi:hypothetical protein